MPRPPRHILPGSPLHITQRGVDRCYTFLEDEDYALYRLVLREASAATGCVIHAYALMSNHVHLLLTPSEAAGPSRMMQSVGRQYVRFLNDKYRRTGTLWEGRFRSAHVDTTRHLFSCYRYIELNPVEAGIVSDPSSYEWSSNGHNTLGIDDPLVTAHPLYDALGDSADARRDAYRTLFGTALSKQDLAELRAATRTRARLHPSSYRQAVDALFGRA